MPVTQVGTAPAALAEPGTPGGVPDGGQHESLASAARGGDRAAAERLLTRLRPVLLRYCLARIGRRETAEDVTQEVLVSVLAALPRYRGQGGGVLAFAYGIASHKVADACRAAWRDRSVPTAQVPDQADTASGPEETVLRGERVVAVRRLLDQLPETQREVLLLRMSGLSAAETAEMLGSTPGAVRIAAHRGLGTLRELLAGDRP